VKVQEINKLQKILEEFRELRPSMRLDLALTILEIAASSGVQPQDLERRLNMSKASSSRHLQSLEKWEKADVEGLDLVDVVTDPADRRNKIAKPNANMKEFMKRIDSIWNR